jgi:hypothetical protein
MCVILSARLSVALFLSFNASTNLCSDHCSLAQPVDDAASLHDRRSSKRDNWSLHHLRRIVGITLKAFRECLSGVSFLFHLVNATVDRDRR